MKITVRFRRHCKTGDATVLHCIATGGGQQLTVKVTLPENPTADEMRAAERTGGNSAKKLLRAELEGK